VTTTWKKGGSFSDSLGPRDLGQGEHGIAHELLTEHRSFESCELIQGLGRFDGLYQGVGVGGIDLGLPLVDEGCLLGGPGLFHRVPVHGSLEFMRQRVPSERAPTDGHRRLDTGAGRRPQWRRLLVALIVGLVLRLVVRVLRLR